MSQRRIWIFFLILGVSIATQLLLESLHWVDSIGFLYTLIVAIIYTSIIFSIFLALTAIWKRLLRSDEPRDH
jgi:hypothetical protein